MLVLVESPWGWVGHAVVGWLVTVVWCELPVHTTYEWGPCGPRCVVVGQVCWHRWECGPVGSGCGGVSGPPVHVD